VAVALEQPPLGAREAVLGQPRDRVEERGAERVVQALDRQAERTRAEAVPDRVAQLRLQQAGGASVASSAILDAAEGRVRVRVAGLEPVPERAAEQRRVGP
jgi:hypothetical protein